MVSNIYFNGYALPQVLDFPSVRYDATIMIHGASDGAKCLAYPSGWMTSKNFIHVINHFKEKVRCNVNKKVLLIMNNYKSHLFIEAIDFAHENSIVILAIPHHISKLQPLD